MFHSFQACFLSHLQTPEAPETSRFSHCLQYLQIADTRYYICCLSMTIKLTMRSPEAALVQENDLREQHGPKSQQVYCMEPAEAYFSGMEICD